MNYKYSIFEDFTHYNLLQWVSEPQRYLDARATVDQEPKFILSFSNLLSQYQDCSCDPMLVDPYALGYFHQLLHHKVLDVMEALDVFLSLAEARQAMAVHVDDG